MYKTKLSQGTLYMICKTKLSYDTYIQGSNCAADIGVDTFNTIQ